MQAGVPHISEAQAVFLEKFFNHQGTITQLAAAMDVPLVDMIDILSAPAVRGRINNAKIITELKRDLIAARAEMAALETLQQITSDRHINPLERRRAATAILRATRPIRARSLRGAGFQPVPNSQSRGIGVSPVSSDPSPPLMPAVDPAIYIPEEEIANFRKETTQARIELDELCAQEDPTPEPLSNHVTPGPNGQRNGPDAQTHDIDASIQGSGIEHDRPQGIAPGDDANTSPSPEGAPQPENTLTRGVDPHAQRTSQDPQHPQSPPPSSPCRSVASSPSSNHDPP